MNQTTTVRVDVDDAGVAVLTLDGADRLNALSGETALVTVTVVIASAFSVSTVAVTSWPGTISRPLAANRGRAPLTMSTSISIRSIFRWCRSRRAAFSRVRVIMAAVR